ITDVDDAAGLLTLADGRVLAFDPDSSPRGKAGSIYEGLEAAIKGSLFADGTGTAEEIGAEKPQDFQGDQPAFPCMVLRIAPVQPFGPNEPGPFVLHHPGGYADGSDVLQLEQGMRLAAIETGCPHSTSQGLTLRYGMEIEVIENLIATEVVASDFEEGDHPVDFPAFSGADGQIKTTVLMESCKQFANGQDVCSAPVEQDVRYYDEYLRSRGHYSTAVYSQTVFSVKDNKIADDFDTVYPVAMDLTDVPLGTNAHFVGEGYAVEANGQSSRPQVVEVDQGEPFAIYEEDDFIADDLLFPLDTVGVTHEAGLIWPRVVGTRNGHEFWYSSKLPELLRDLVSICPDDPDSWYRLPFFDGWPTWIVNTGNFGDPIHGHGASQPFAWDINAPTDTDIAAARGGTVVWMVEDEYLNAKFYPKDPSDPSKVDPSYTKVGNFIWILHDDGTLSSYNHLDQWGALVDEGDVVHRGQHIAEVGNTGYSSQSHLHYEGGLVTVDWHKAKPSITKLPVRFEAAVGEGDPVPSEWIEKDCYVPKAHDKLLSTQ
ncbi:MAG TPA: M23 family metallopeptidase, partial [Actinomycetota bacterium]